MECFLTARRMTVSLALAFVALGMSTIGVQPAMAAKGACCSGTADVVQTDLPGLEYTYGGLGFPTYRSTTFDFGIDFSGVHSAWLVLEGFTDLTGSTMQLIANLEGLDAPTVNYRVEGRYWFPPFTVTVPLLVGAELQDGAGSISLSLTTTGDGKDLSSTVRKATLYVDVEECTYITQRRCTNAGGAYQGDGVTCESDPCPDGPGACCFCDAACQDLRAGDCAAAGGIFKGEGTTCVSSTCPAPTDGIECPMELTCNTTVVVDNRSFTIADDDPLFSCAPFGPAKGHGTGWFTFVANDTTARVSTCNSMVNDTLVAIYEGTPGNLTEVGCADDTCPAGGHLSDLCVGGLVIGQTYYVEVAGFYSQDLGRTTIELECPCPAAACCMVDGACSELNDYACAAAVGDFQGVGSDCPSADCPEICGPGAGDCFRANGTSGCEDVSCCEVVCGADPYCCDNDWDQICAAAAEVACGDVKGACCLPGDDCQLVSASECTILGGVYRGDDTECLTLAHNPGTLSSTPHLAIPDNEPHGVSDVINVIASQVVGDVNINVEIAHSWIADLIIEIEHGGKTVVLWYGQCGGVADMDILFDDEGLANNACADVPNGVVVQQPADKVFLRNFGLTSFSGMDVAGSWTLTVKDDLPGAVGTLTAWSLIVDEAVPSGECDN